MTSYPLIDQYLAELRRHLGQDRRADDICAEARDHLPAAVERHQVAGMDPDYAQRRALADYGSVRRIARAFTRTPDHPAVPTRTTQIAGTGATAGAVLWLTIDAAQVASANGLISAPTYLWPLLRVAVVGLLYWGLVGLLFRHGGANGLLGWRGPTGLVLAAACGGSDLARRHPSSGPPGTGLRTCARPCAAHLPQRGPVVARYCAVGRRHHPSPTDRVRDVLPCRIDRLAVDAHGFGRAEAASIGVPVGSIVAFMGTAGLAVGLVGLGRWLRSEIPVEGPDTALA